LAFLVFFKCKDSCRSDSIVGFELSFRALL
jgi:hypothetical protein